MIRFHRAVRLAALLIVIAGAAHAQCGKCAYAKRGDRYEGVGARQVSGASFELLSVQYLPAGNPTATGRDVHLYFWLPAAETPSIEVWEPRTNYYMVPDRRPFEAGPQAFSWPRGEVLAPLGLESASLYPKISNRDKTLYFPAALSTGPRPQPDGRTLFVFRSGAGIDVYCTLSRDEKGTMVPVRKFRHTEDLGGTLRIVWDGKDDQGKPAPEGTYLLRLKGEMMAETQRPLTSSLSFLHHAGHR
jgi:hypothetical protein